MHDVFIEQIVKRKRTVRDRIIFIFVIIAVITVPAVLTVLAMNEIILNYFLVISLFILLFGIWYIWFVRSHQNSEFEYQLVHDTLVVSKIIAKRKRKELLRLDVRSIEQLDTYKNIGNVNVARAVEACTDINDEQNTYCALYSGAAGGKRALFFNPNEGLLNAMKPFLKKEIVLKLFYNR